MRQSQHSRRRRWRKTGSLLKNTPVRNETKQWEWNPKGLHNRGAAQFRCWWQGGSGHTRPCSALQEGNSTSAAGSWPGPSPRVVLMSQSPHPAYLPKSKPVTQFPSSIPAIHPRPPPTHTHTYTHAMHAGSSHQENIRGLFSSWMHGRWMILSCSTAALFLPSWSYHTNKRAEKTRLQLMSPPIIEYCLDWYHHCWMNWFIIQ